MTHRVLVGGNECQCHFDPGQINTVSDVTPTADDRAGGNGATGNPTQVQAYADFKCYLITSGCNAKVLAAVDRTYRKNVAANAQEIESALSEVNNALAYGDLTFGLVAVLQHRLKWWLRMDNPDAQDQTQVANMISTSIVGGWKHRATNFWPLFTTTYGNMVADPTMPGAILLFTDGQLRHRKHWRQFKKRKAKMANALGNQMPLIICWRIGSSKTSKFLSTVCDHVVYTGMESKTEAQVAADVQELICSVD